MLRYLCRAAKRVRFPWSSRVSFKDPLEEQTVTACSPTDWYPVMIGEMFLEQYKVLGKIGWGQTSTVWLCSDLENNDYKVMKMCIHERGSSSSEERAYDAMNGITTSNTGVQHLRLVQDEFDVTGPSGYSHHAFIFEPAACNIAQILRVVGRQKLIMVKVVAYATLHALDFLHSDVHCVHTDIKARNILLKLQDGKILDNFVQALQDDPPKPSGSRKKGTLVYPSRHFDDLAKKGWDAPILSDLGEAQLLCGKTDMDPLPIGPLAIRAPENVLGMRWGYPIDIWQASCMLFNVATNTQLFDMPADVDGWSMTLHLAQMVALLGPPPPDFVSRSEECKTYFHEDGSWKAHEGVLVPNMSLEGKLAVVEDDKKALLMNLLNEMLKWKPEERRSAKELVKHPFVLFD